MPRPQPAEEPEVAVEPVLGDFDYLLRELSTQFERLQQQNLSLARKCKELYAAKSEGGSTPTVQEEIKSNKKDESARLSANRNNEKEEPVPYISAFPESPKSVWRTGMDMTSASQAPSHHFASETTSRHTKDFAASTKLSYEAFRALDLDDTGNLTLDDLVRVFNTAGEPVNRGAVINILRIANDMEPLEIDVDGSSLCSALNHAVAESENLVLDLEAFTRLMDGTELCSVLPPAVEECLEGFRRACVPGKHRRATQHFARAPPPRTAVRRSLSRVSPSIGFWVETLPTIVILVNALITGLSADHPEHEVMWDTFEYFFVAFYTMEFAVKIHIYGWSGYFMGSVRWWNLFDLACLLISIADTLVKVSLQLFVDTASEPDLGPLLLIKIFRLARLARLVRTLRFKIFHELKLMVLGVFSGLRVLSWAIVLLVVLVYVFGVAMKNLFGENTPEFSSVLASMFTLFRCWTEGCAAYDGTPLAERLRVSYGPLFVVYHILMTMFVTVGVFNLIMAIFIDNVVTTQMMRKHKEMADKTHDIEMKFKRLFTGFVKDGLATKSRNEGTFYDRACREFMRLRPSRGNSRIDLTAPGASNIEAEWERLREMQMTISRDVFRAWLAEPEFHRLLDEAEIESANHFELFDVLDADMGGELSMDELTCGLMKLRGPVTKADIVACRLKVRHVTKMVESLLPEGSDMIQKTISVYR